MDEQNQENDGGEGRRCAACNRELRFGDDAVVIENGVFGPRGFVPLGNKTYVCDHVCLAAYAAGSATHIERIKRRLS
jgi:hypothetical protein